MSDQTGDNSERPFAVDFSHLEKWRCPGVFRDIEFLPCPRCGEEVEFFPQDLVMACDGCGAEVTRVSSACISHCPAMESFCYRQMVRSQALMAGETENGE
jgi:predicted amidophosphoribosyltransferase